MVPVHSHTSVKTGPKQTQTKNESSQETRGAWDGERGYFDGVTWTPELSGYINCKNSRFSSFEIKPMWVEYLLLEAKSLK